MTEDKKPREFWILKLWPLQEHEGKQQYLVSEIPMVKDAWIEECVQFIEKSAYDQLAAELADVKSSLAANWLASQREALLDEQKKSEALETICAELIESLEFLCEVGTENPMGHLNAGLVRCRKELEKAKAALNE